MGKTRIRTAGSVKALIGPRRRQGQIEPEAELQAGLGLVKTLSEAVSHAADLAELKAKFGDVCRTYYTLAAISRRKSLSDDLRQRILGVLFPLRSRLEKRLLAEFQLLADKAELWRTAVGRSFFGVSAKQGVSIRYPLSSCVPTSLCGGRCYGHDGRDRELHLIFRAALNGCVGYAYESAATAERHRILRDLDGALRYGIAKALEDAELSCQLGYVREPRIRFSHIGDMAATPSFANALAAEIRRREPSMACIIYTRHPRASELDPALLRVNFSLDSAGDSRRKMAPDFARLVSSAWDGQVTNSVEINFLEHHVEKSTHASGLGFICPVTLHHDTTPSCDEARCDRCFRKPSPER